MDTTTETLIGTLPREPLTNRQKRAHKKLARAEKHLIYLMVWEHPASEVDEQDAKVRRLTTAWKKACAR